MNLDDMYSQPESFFSSGEFADDSPEPAPSPNKRPALTLPGEGRWLGEFAAELGRALAPHRIFTRNGEVVTIDFEQERIVPITPDKLRTLAEKYCRFYGLDYRERRVKDSMMRDTAYAVAVSPQLHENLPPLLQLNFCRQPIIREDGAIDLLPAGYDESSGILTLDRVQFDAALPAENAIRFLRELFREFKFADPERSLAVAISSMLGLFGARLLPKRSLRPCLVVLANAEGAGKTLLVKLLVNPTFGTAPIGTRPDKEEEFEKVLLTAVREGRQILFLDNVRGLLASGRLEAFLSSEVWQGRILGKSESYTGENLATVFVTGNGLQVSPDLRRRCLFIELILDVERAEDRKFEQPLNDEVIRQLRPHLLAAMWSLIRHWDQRGRPAAARDHTGFPEWATTFGGIVEAAGFACPLDTPQISMPLDREGEDMRRLVMEMPISQRCTFQHLVDMMRANGCFENIVGIAAEGEAEFGDEARPFGANDRPKLGPSAVSRLGRLLSRYNGRQVGDRRFQVLGQGHSRAYVAQPLGEQPS